MDYQKLKPLVYSQIWKQVKKTGLPFEEAESTANLGFAIASKTYDESHGAKFHSWVYAQINYAFLNAQRVERKYTTRNLPMCEFDLEPAITDPEQMSDDAMFVLRVVFEDFDLLKNKATKTAVRRHLKKEGWAKERIDAVFVEIQSAI